MLKFQIFLASSNGYDDTTGEPRVTSEIHRRQVVDIGNWSTAAEQHCFRR